MGPVGQYHSSMHMTCNGCPKRRRQQKGEKDYFNK